MAGPLKEMFRNTPVLNLPGQFMRAFGHFVKPIMPRTINGRFVLIIVAPVVLIQIISTWLYMERYSQQTTRRLSAAVAGEIAFLISAAELEDNKIARNLLFKSASEHQNIDIEIVEGAVLPPQLPVSIFSFISKIMSEQLEAKIQRPLWFDLEKRPSIVEIQVQLDGAVMSIEVRRSRIIATNWHIYLVWTVVAMFLFVGIAIIFLRNQVRAILRLALAAENFGKGRDVPDFKPSGAREVRAASQAVIDMRNRINAHVSQRTEMLAGVSHDMRTPLTRLKLQLAMLGSGGEIEDMKADIVEMEYMLTEYLDFARGQATEETVLIDVGVVLGEIKAGALVKGSEVELQVPDDLAFQLKRMAFKRCITNLVNNACNFGTEVRIKAFQIKAGALIVVVDDNGPGIPEHRREEAFRPFHRLDDGRNLDQGGSGLGLAIARDVAKAHGGDIRLEASKLGGLRAVVTLPG